MRYIFFVLFSFLCIVFIACKPAAYPKLVTNIKNADSVLVQFFEPGTLKNLKFKVSNEALGITKLTEYIEGSGKGAKNTCPVDGYICFYEKGKKLLTATLQYRNDCWQLNPELDGKIVYIAMQAEGKTFFTALEREAQKNEIILNF
jgi:hypothetical protein